MATTATSSGRVSHLYLVDSLEKQIRELQFTNRELQRSQARGTGGSNLRFASTGRPEYSPPRRSYLDRSDDERSLEIEVARLRAENDALIEEGAAFRTRMAAAVDRFEGLERTFLQTEAERRELAAELADAKRKLGDELADARYELVNARSPPRSPRTLASGASPSRGSRSSPARQTQQHESSTQTLQEATTARVAAASDLAFLASRRY